MFKTDEIDKIKENMKKYFDKLSKKHKLLALVLIILLVLYISKGIIWIYNDIFYGRFEKVAEKVDIGPQNQIVHIYDSKALLAGNNGAVLIDLKNKTNRYKKNYKLKECTSIHSLKKGDFLCSHLDKKDKSKSEVYIYNIFDDKFKKIGHIMHPFAALEIENSILLKLEIDTNNKLYEYTNEKLNKITSKPIYPIRSFTSIKKLDKENVLLHYGASEFHTFNIKTHKFTELESIDPVESGTFRWLGDNMFIVANNYYDDRGVCFKNIIKLDVYEIKENKIRKIKSGQRNEYFILNPFGDIFSTVFENGKFIKLDNNILILGTHKGFGAMPIETNEAYILNIKSGRIKKINNFYGYVYKMNAEKLNDSHFIMTGDYKGKNCLHEEGHYRRCYGDIFLYRQGLIR